MSSPVEMSRRPSDTPDRRRLGSKEPLPPRTTARAWRPTPSPGPDRPGWRRRAPCQPPRRRRATTTGSVAPQHHAVLHGQPHQRGAVNGPPHPGPLSVPIVKPTLASGENVTKPAGRRRKASARVGTCDEVQAATTNPTSTTTTDATRIPFPPRDEGTPSVKGRCVRQGWGSRRSSVAFRPSPNIRRCWHRWRPL